MMGKSFKGIIFVWQFTEVLLCLEMNCRYYSKIYIDELLILLFRFVHPSVIASYFQLPRLQATTMVDGCIRPRRNNNRMDRIDMSYECFCRCLKTNKKLSNYIFSPKYTESFKILLDMTRIPYKLQNKDHIKRLSNNLINYYIGWVFLCSRHNISHSR